MWLIWQEDVALPAPQSRKPHFLHQSSISRDIRITVFHEIELSERPGYSESSDYSVFERKPAETAIRSEEPAGRARFTKPDGRAKKWGIILPESLRCRFKAQISSYEQKTSCFRHRADVLGISLINLLREFAVRNIYVAGRRSISASKQWNAEIRAVALRFQRIRSRTTVAFSSQL